ncbi:MAG TPA: DUF748 domain-containing protein [Desulfosalsimonadaceae bacterium]|nr:DUF748 domain-containing protein [Desulfosalsimonadaceae bacterium]
MGWKNWGWKKKTGIILGILILLYTISGFLVIPMVTEAILPDKLSAQLDRPVQVENVSLNPYTLTLSVKGLNIGEKSGDADFVAFDEFFANIQWASLFKLGLVAREVRLKQPFVRVARISETEFNFSDLIPAEKADQKSEPEDKAPGEPFHFHLSNVRVMNGEFQFHDQPMDKTHRFDNVSFTIPMLSNFKPHVDAYAQPVLAGELNGTQLKVDVSTKPFAKSMETTVDVTLAGVNLPYYFDYVPVDLGLDIGQGNLDLETKLDFKQTPAGETQLEISAIADLADLQVTDAAAGEILALSDLHVEMAPSRPLEKQIRLATVSLTEPVVTLVRSFDGKLNLAQLGPQGEDRSTASNAEPSKAAQTNADSETAEAGVKESTAAEAKEPESDPFIFELGKLNLSSGTLNYRDFAAPGASATPHGGPVQMTVKDLNLTVTGFTTKRNQTAQVDLSASLDPDAALSVNGEFGMTPLTVDTAIQIEGLALNRAQPYFPDALNLVVTDGRFHLSGNARLNSNQNKGLSAQLKGDSGIRDLKLLESKSAREFVKWQAFDINGIDVSYNPTRVNLKTLAIEGLKQNLIVEKDGRLNVGQIWAAEPAEPSEPETSEAADKKESVEKEQTQKAAAPFPVSIGEIKLRDIGISFTDYQVDPNYSAEVAFDEGSITGLSTEAFEGAKVSLKGAVNEHAPIDISGRINPLLADLLLDISFRLQNMELSPFSAYSGKYIGKAIEKGKLNLDLDYLIENKKLEAENQVLLNQFTLGHGVESKTAVNLPVGLAIALLKDRKGKIDLDLPVSGRLDDPEFSLTGVIIQSLKNLVAKAATSPFALVSSIVPGGEELRYIEFKAGSADLDDAAEKKLDAIIKLLYERPALNLELTGYVAPEDDRAALKAAALERKIRAAKWAETSEQTETETIPFEEIELTDEEYLKYLRQVYKAEVLAAPDAPEDAKSLGDESLTAAEMKAKIRVRIEVTDAELRLLAQNRVQAVKDYILADDRIAGKRLFIREAETLMPSDAGKFKASRVELNLN